MAAKDTGSDLERRLAEAEAEIAAMRASEHRCRTLFDAIDEAFCVIEMLFDDAGNPVDYRVLETNAAFTRQTGLGDVIGQTMRQIAPTHEQFWYDTYGRIALTGEPARFEHQAAALDRWYDVYAFRLAPPDQRHVAVLFRDIIARKRSEAAVRTSEERLRALVGTAATSVYRMSPDWTLMYQLDSRDFLATTAEPIRDWEERYILPEDRQQVRATIATSIQNRSVFELEHRFAFPNDNIGWVMSRAVPILSPDGALIEWFGTAVDITERKRAEAALRASEERHAFLLKLSDALRSLADPLAIQEVTCSMLGEHLGVDWVQYSEIDSQRGLIINARDFFRRSSPAHRGLPSHIGTYDLAIYPVHAAHWSAGRSLSIADVAADETLSDGERHGLLAYSVAAALTAPLRKDEKPIAVIAALSATSRHWTNDDVVLLEQVAERTWDAVERARTEAALREREADLARVQRIGGIGGIDIDVAGGLRAERSPEYLKLHGLPLDTVEETHTDWLARVHPDDRVEAEGALFAALGSDAGSYAIEYRIVRPIDGEMRWISARADIERDPAGKPSRLVGAHVDITEQKRAQEALRLSEERLALALRTLPVGVAIIDSDGATRVANERMLRFMPSGTVPSHDSEHTARWIGFTPDGKRIPPSDFAGARALRGETVFGLEMLFRQDDGREVWTQLSAAPMRDSEGKIEGAFVVVHDVDRLKRSEEALRASETRLQTLVEGVPQLVWRAVDGGLWTWASPQWTEFTGQSDGDSHAFGWLDPVHPDDRDKVREIWSHALERGEFRADYRVCHLSEQRYRWFQTSATPVRNADGAITEWVGTSTDVDDLRQLQDRQRLLLAELQHRVRNILTVVRSVFSRTIDVEGPVDALENIADHFKGRLDSLARTQVVVTQSAHGSVDLENMIRDELLSVGAADGPNLTIEGPDVALRPKEAESLGLAIHELTTNALKYGALKVPGGRLEIRWSTNMHYGSARRLDLTWREQGVPAISLRPARRGFGSELIEEALPYRLGAETKLEFRGGGVRCAISMPLSEGAATPRER